MSESEGEVIDGGAPPEVRVLPDPPNLANMDLAFKAVRAQSDFQAARTNWIGQCEHNMEALNEAVFYLNSEDPASQLSEVASRINWTIDHVSELRAEVAAIQPPPPPPPPETPLSPLTEEQVNVARRTERALKMMGELQINTLLQCDQMSVTLETAKAWCAEADAVDHMEDITNGVYGCLEQMSRLRSTLGSTQS